RPVQQTLQSSVEEPGRDPETQPATAIALSGPSAGLVVPDQACRGIADCRFIRTRDDQPARALLEHDDPNSVHYRRLYPELGRAAVGDTHCIHPAKLGIG